MVRAKQISLIGALMVAFTASGTAGAFALDDPAGFWATEKHESQIKITHCGADTICGSIFWMKEPNDAKGNPKLDKENADAVKRKHPLIGLQLISMKADDDHWKGTVYNPQNGKTYSATLKILDKDQVELEGCVAYVLCGDQKWTREEPRQTATSAPAVATTGTGAHGTAKAPAPTPEKSDEE